MIKGATKYFTLALLLAATYLPVGAYITHYVERGETLWGISHKYNVSADDIIKLNPSVANGLKAGTTIQIPDGTEQETEASEKSEQSEQSEESAQSEQSEQNSVVEDKSYPTVPSVVELPIFRTDESSEGGTYVARFGDTFESISKKTGISVEDLISLNPLLNSYAIPESEVIRLSATSPFQTNKAYLSIVDSVVYRVEMPPVDSNNSSSQGNAIAILLPFDLTHNEISRQSLLSTDFYKGFLIATKENSGKIDNTTRIYAIDTQCSEDELNDKLMKIARDGVKIVVPPDDIRQTELIEKFAADNDIAVVNILNVKDEGYLTLPNVVQCNISQKLMYDKAIKTLLSDFEEFTPVILDLAGGKDEKLSFIEELRSQYAAQGRDVIDLNFNYMLSENDLAEALKTDQKYIFIPKSGSIDVFEKFSNALASYIENDGEYGRLKLFGYPDWVTFRGESAEALHNLGAVIYSRFHFDPTHSNTTELNKDFTNWYGTPQNDVFPAQGTMGYDAGNMLYRMIRDGWLNTMTQNGAIGSYTGLQSAYHLVKDPDIPGIVNDALYIIEFLPEGSTYIKVI